MATINKVKQAIQNKTKAYGMVLTWPSPQIIELVGTLGFDYVQIDGEHGAFDLVDVEEACRTAELVGLTLIARVPNIESSTINQFLDRGVQGIIGPHISNKADAEQLVRASCFGPMGERSFGGGRGVHFGLRKNDRPGYYAEANRQMLVGAMLEDRASMDNLDDIMAVPGIDFFYIGMNDFSQGHGYPGGADAPEVLKARAEAFERVHAAGKLMREDFIVETTSIEMIINGAKKVTDKRSQDREAAKGGK
ncbi:MAG: aldolase/citrate lyase family protein [Pseudomonadota bacterium]